MKFILNPKVSIYNFMRRLGYHFQREEKEEMSFYRPLQGKGFPRFHLYLKKQGENTLFNLHLDQKKPIYKGSSAHSGEYDTEIVKKEAERIKNENQ